MISIPDIALGTLGTWALAFATVAVVVWRWKKKKRNLRIALRAEGKTTPNITRITPLPIGALEDMIKLLPRDIYESHLDELSYLSAGEVEAVVKYYSLAESMEVLRQTGEETISSLVDERQKIDDAIDEIADQLEEELKGGDYAEQEIDDLTSGIRNRDSETIEGWIDSHPEVLNGAIKTGFLPRFDDLTERRDDLQNMIEMLDDGTALELNLRDLEHSRQEMIVELESHLPPQYQTTEIEDEIQQDFRENAFYQEVMDWDE